MKKFITSLVAGLLMLVAGIITGQVFQFLVPSIKIEYQNQNLFRPWSDPLMSMVFIEPFILSFILILLWDLTNNLIKGDTKLEKGLRFGFIYWLISIPGMIMSYSSFPVSFLLVLSWSISSLLQILCAGVYFSKVLK